MHLKRMELIGFKSFAEKTVFHLEPCVTAFIGPNGSGKSNVVDALRWALGEQSAKKLRGSEMQDVIFAGSPSHGPASFAEVSLVFDNSDRTLPLDFDEVVVTRRLHRSGESEYLINRRGCLLRDVKELFLGTGIGGGAYNIVEQGKVDALLQAGPQERRKLFEEVAGISGYKMKRDAARRRLERLSLHLEAVNTVISDIRRRLRSLARQVGKARRYAELSDEVRRLELDIHARRFRSLERRAGELASLIDDRRGRLSSLQSALSEIEAAELDRARRRSELQQALSSLRSELTEARVRAERAEAASSAAELRRRSELARSAELRRSSEEASRKHEALLLQAREVEREISSLSERADELSAALEEHNRRLMELKSRAEADSRDVEALRNAAFDAARKRSRLETELAAARKRLAETETRSGSLRSRLAAAEAGLGEHRGRLAVLALHRDFETAAARRLDTLARAFSARKHGSPEGPARRLPETLRRRSEVLSEKAELLRNMEKTGHGLTGHGADVVKRLSEREDFAGILSSLINAPARYRRAVEAALGDAAEAVVLEGGLDEDLLDTLKDARGEVVFPAEADGPAATPSVEFPAAVPLLQLVEFPPRLRGLLGRLLGKVFLLPRTDWAAGFVREYPRLTAVTEEGVVFRGPERASVRGDRAAGRLVGRRKALEKIESSVRSLAARLAAANRIASLRKDRAAKRRERAEALSARLSRRRSALRSVEDALRNAAVEGERARREKTFLEEQLASLEAEALEARKTAEALPDAIRSLEAEEERLSSLIRDKDRSGRTLEDSIEEVRSAMQRLQDALARAEEKRIAAESRLKTLRSAAEEADALAARSAAEAAAAVEAAGEAERETARAKEEKAAAVAAAAEAERRLKELASALETLELDSAAKGEDRRRLEAEAAALRDELEELRLEENTLSMERSSILKETAEKYRQDASALAAALPEDAAPPSDEEIDELRSMKERLERMGPVNLAAIEEERELKERYEFLDREVADLEGARRHLREAIDRLDKFCRERFEEAFEKVGENFQDLFRKLFQGGEARLRLLGEDPLEAGIEITVRPPGKEPRILSLLSGGEKAMAAIALIMAAFKASPSPFCVLDEVDGPLDEANVDRLNAIIRDFSKGTQFIVVTHNKLTMARSDVIYGITMELPGISRYVRKEMVREEKDNLAVA